MSHSAKEMLIKAERSVLEKRLLQRLEISAKKKNKFVMSAVN